MKTEGMATPWTLRGNLLNKGSGNVDDTDDGPSDMSASELYHSLVYLFLESFYKHKPRFRRLYDKHQAPLLCVPRKSSLLFKLWSIMPSCASSTQTQPTASQWTQRILTPLWVRSRVFTQHSRWSSILFRQLPNTQPEGCPITHRPRHVCAITTLYILCLTWIRTSIRQEKLYIFFFLLTLAGNCALM